MSERAVSTPDTNPSADKKFSFSMQLGAASGRFSTRRQSSSEKTGGTEESTSSTPPRSAGKNRFSQDNPSKVPVTYRNGVGNLAVPIESNEQEKLPADRINFDPSNYFSATKGRSDLLITASAAKSLTRLFAALSIEPGSGREVPAHIRSLVLDTLVRNAHELANSVATSVAGQGMKVPKYLRAKLLQQAAEFLSDQWIKYGVSDIRDLTELAHRAFSGQVDAIDQQTVDLFHHAGEYTPADTQQISEARITEAVVRASWAMYRQVTDIYINEYDPNWDKSQDPEPFTYGRSAHEVSLALTKIALSITHENQLDIDHLDLRTTWTQNSIERASTLVRAEYRMLTDRALRSCFKEELMSEAAIHSVNEMYDKILERIHERARNAFILVERNAVDAMSASSYRKYLPKVSDKDRQASDRDFTKENEATVPSSEPEAPASVAKTIKPFSFG